MFGAVQPTAKLFKTNFQCHSKLSVNLALRLILFFLSSVVFEIFLLKACFFLLFDISLWVNSVKEKNLVTNKNLELQQSLSSGAKKAFGIRIFFL